MINDLIKRCQEEGCCDNCKECGYNADNLDDEICCLIELLDMFNTKYKTNYGIVDFNKLKKARSLLNEC